MPKGRAAPQHCALGVSAVAGAQVWDAQARFIIRFGPLTRAEFDALLPGTPAWQRITQLARLFVGQDTAFAVNLVLRAEEVPPARAGGGARLGWSSWTPTTRPRRRDAADALFEPRDVA
jgi:type VI secretion system protein ImpH